MKFNTYKQYIQFNDLLIENFYLVRFFIIHTKRNKLYNFLNNEI